MNRLLSLILFLAASFLAGAIGAQFTPGAWYDALQKPLWNPPDWVFAPVWTLLYVLIALSAWVAWRSRAPGDAPAFVFFFLQLGLNALWSWLFFGLHLPGAAFAEILILWATIVVTAFLFWRIAPTAGLLLLPYLAWVSFAVSLNGAIWLLNS